MPRSLRLLCFALLMSMDRPVSGAAPAPAEVIAGYRTWLAKHGSFTATGTDAITVNSSTVPPNFNFMQITVSIATDGKTKSRFKESSSYITVNKKGDFLPRREVNDALVDSIRLSIFTSRGAKGDDKAVIMTLGEKEKASANVMHQCVGDAYFFGSLFRTCPTSACTEPPLKLVDLLSLSSPTASLPTANNPQIVRLEGESSWGFITADFDVANGYEPVRFQHRRKSHHFINGDKNWRTFAWGSITCHKSPTRI